MRILLLGGLGQLGTDFRRLLDGHTVASVDKEDLDVTVREQVDALLDSSRPDVAINCAAYNRVDDAEDCPDAAFAVNARAVLYIARACERAGARLLHYSTDYVFDSPERRPLTESDAPTPASVYGVSKLAGEHMARIGCANTWVVRTCGLYGHAGSREKGTNFVETMLRLAGGPKPVKVVDDQFCAPTSTMDLARASLQLITNGAPFGLYHLTNTGVCSWHEFAREIFRLAGKSPEPVPVSSAEFTVRARRPRYSVLDNAAFRSAGFPDLRPWQAALEEYLRTRPDPRP
jgi:dTDP-4-dehydrorhamnose reductase